MGKTKELLGVLDTYIDLYSYVSKGKRNQQDAVKYLQSKEKGASTAADHVKAARQGKLKYILCEDDMLSLNCHDLAEELTAVLSQLNLEVWIAEKKGKQEDRIPTITSGKSQQYENMDKEVKTANSKCRKFEQQLKEKDSEIENLKKQIGQIACEAVLTEMDKKTLVPASVASKPAEILAKDFFKESPGADIDFTKYVSKEKEETVIAGVYNTEVESEKTLAVRNVINRVCSQFRECRVYQKLLSRRKSDEVDDTKQTSDRERSIALLLANNEMDNQTKLATYALWYFRGDPEMEELLSYAGNYCIDANYVIRLLEQPEAEHNYRTVRAFLKQALSASEAHIKCQTVQELLCGDWQAIAQYRGKMCHFRLVPVEELLAFRNLLLKNDISGAACKACHMVKTTFGPLDQKLKSQGNQKQIEAPDFLHEADGDVDIHAPVDEDVVLNDFEEGEEKANEQ